MTCTRKLISSILFIFIIFSGAKAATYTTINNGAWNDIANVWSLDGFTPCGCTPGATSAGNDIVINNTIMMSYNIVINAGSNFLLSASGQLNGGKNINTWNSTLDFWGTIDIGKYTQAVGGVTNVHIGSVLLMSNSLAVEKGFFTLDGAVINSGGLSVGATATFVTMNMSRMYVVSGNLTNNGSLTIGAGCCVQTNGNWKNNAGGTVLGTGSANSGGNINNAGTWSLGVVWCSTGGDLGMPTSEDCAAANGICNAIVLPVELTNFAANILDEEYTLISWETASETNNDYFIVEKSTDGIEWSEIDRIEGAGTSIRTIYYSSFDYNLEIGTSYYRLTQVDYDNRSTVSEVRAVVLKGNDSKLEVYPNPASSQSFITVRNVENGDGLYIQNSAGMVSIQEVVDTDNGFVKIDISALTPGMYFISTQRSESNETLKLIVTR